MLVNLAKGRLVVSIQFLILRLATDDNRGIDTRVRYLRSESSHASHSMHACRLNQKMQDSPYAVGMRLAFVPMSCDIFETPAGSRQPGAAWVALFAVVSAHRAVPRGSRPPAITVHFVGKLVRYVHCTRRALSFLDWCGSCAVDNLGTNGS